MWKWLAGLFGFGKRKPIQASYDSAATTVENERHWINTDSLSANAANQLATRQTLRERSRYERDNNGYGVGMYRTLANDIVGTGPQLKLTDQYKEVAKRWKEWTAAIGFREHLVTATEAKKVDGEIFFMLTSDPELRCDVKLDIKLIECDQVTTPNTSAWWFTHGLVDGIEFKPNGKPKAYHVLKYHPGDNTPVGAWNWMDYDTVKAENMLHWFRRDRPGQSRGIPEFTASLPLFAQLRRFSLATLTAAEVAANFAAVLETEAPAYESDDATLDDAEPANWEPLKINRGTMTTLPPGAKLNQFKSEHPTTQYAQFKGELLKEIGRPGCVPYCVVACDSSPYNYSSVRMDHLGYRSVVRTERTHCCEVVGNPLYRAWYAEARLVYGWAEVEPPTPEWYWPGFYSIDPLKEANADAVNLANGITTLEELLAEHGQDWARFIAQRAKEIQQMRAAGIPVPGDTQPQEEPDEEDSSDPPESGAGRAADA